MNPRAEAAARLGNGFEARVLEPSPPAVADPPWFADDPAARGEPMTGRRVVSPVSTGDVTWDDLARGDRELAAFCSDRWLGAWRRLGPLPHDFAATRAALHRVALEVVAPARERITGKIGLRWTRGGFGTPFFGDDEQVRTEAGELVTVGPLGVRRTRLEGVDPAAARTLGDWYGFGTSVLEELRARAIAADEPSRVQLWPEHFDLGLEVGSEEAGIRAGCGASPGDDDHPEPYLYVQPWTARPEGALWEAKGFAGAELPYSRLLAAADQRGLALDFFRTRLRALRAPARTEAR